MDKEKMIPLSCPFCTSWESDNEINIARHFEKEHEYKALLILARMLLGNKPLEQRIRDRIAYLEKAIVAGTSDLVTKDGVAWSKELHQTRIDELRKLIPK
jgi:hypothetical protein